MNFSTSINLKEDLDFNFNTLYMGDEITLRVISDNDRYNVLHNDKTIGHIRPGGIEHIWYVADTNYTPSYLVDEIGNRIQAQIRLLDLAS